MTYHVVCESKLLTVDHESGPTLVEKLLAVEASVLHQVHIALLLRDSQIVFSDVVGVCGDLCLVLGNSSVVGWDAVLECSDVSLKGDHGEA